MQSMKHYLLLAIFYLFSFAVEAQKLLSVSLEGTVG